MDVVERLGDGLVQQGAVRLDVADEHGDPIVVPGLAFIGAKDHWGSVGLVGLAPADDLPASQMTGVVDAFERLTHDLRQNARVLTIFTRYGAASVKLGAFGILCFVFERGCPASTAAFVKAQRRGKASKIEYVLCWSADVPAGRVHDHGMLPRGVFPKKKWVEGVLRDSATLR